MFLLACVIALRGSCLRMRESHICVSRCRPLPFPQPPPHVNYVKPMPDIEQLMQVWPDDFEKVLQQSALPSPELDLDIETYAKVVCSLLDIPVYEKVRAERRASVTAWRTGRLQTR